MTEPCPLGWKDARCGRFGPCGCEPTTAGPTAPDPVTDVWELLWTAACDYRDTAGPERSEARLIDALMPIVRAYAAGELDAVADELAHVRSGHVAQHIRDRAAALRSEESA